MLLGKRLEVTEGVRDDPLHLGLLSFRSVDPPEDELRSELGPLLHRLEILWTMAAESVAESSGGYRRGHRHRRGRDRPVEQRPREDADKTPRKNRCRVLRLSCFVSLLTVTSFGIRHSVRNTVDPVRKVL